MKMKKLLLSIFSLLFVLSISASNIETPVAHVTPHVSVHVTPHVSSVHMTSVPHVESLSHPVVSISTVHPMSESHTTPHVNVPRYTSFSRNNVPTFYNHPSGYWYFVIINNHTRKQDTISAPTQIELKEKVRSMITNEDDMTETEKSLGFIVITVAGTFVVILLVNYFYTRRQKKVDEFLA